MISHKELITYYLELSSLAPNKTWSEEEFKDNPPRKIRYKRLSVLSQLYNVNIDYSNNGNSLNINNEERFSFEELMSKISKENKQSLFESTDLKEIKNRLILDKPYWWNYFFNKLIEMRLNLYRFETTNSGYLCGAGLVILPVIINNHINKNLQNSINLLENILSYLINPTEQSFELKELSEKFNYPIDNIEDIDWEWV